MRKIKYLDKVIMPSGSIIIDETGEDFFDYEKAITTSMDEMIRILAKKYLPYKKSSGRKYIKLNIYNLSAIRIAPSIETPANFV